MFSARTTSFPATNKTATPCSSTCTAAMAPRLALAAVVMAQAALAASSCAGSISFTQDGVASSWAMLTFDWAKATASGSSVTLQMNDRAYLVPACGGERRGRAFCAADWALRVSQPVVHVRCPPLRLQPSARPSIGRWCSPARRSPSPLTSTRWDATATRPCTPSACQARTPRAPGRSPPQGTTMPMPTACLACGALRWTTLRATTGAARRQQVRWHARDRRTLIAIIAPLAAGP